MVHPLNQCGIGKDGNPEAAGQTMAAPDERMLMLIPTSSGLFDHPFSFGPRFELTAFQGE